LTALRAYIVAGQPKQPHPVMGSFEEWSRRVRDALTWLGEADPLGDTDKMEDTDPIRMKLRALLLAWHGAFNSIPSTCAEAVARANETQRDETGTETPTDPMLYETLTEFFSDPKSGKVSAEQLGNFLKKYQRRIECGARFEGAGKRGPRALWRVFVTDKTGFESSDYKASKASKAVYP
jgi:putative DNA primase/helicase